jgi:hypothetical protein
MQITLNQKESDWLENNWIEADLLDWNEWKNQYGNTSHTARELLRIRKLLSQENRKEFRRIHSARMSRLQEEADAGRIGGAIKNIMGRSQPFTMESIRDGDEVITDGATIAKMITAFFAE